jgi:hypothetical protein
MLIQFVLPRVLIVLQTCRYLAAVSRSRYLWSSLLRRDIICCRVPLPFYHKPIIDLRSSDIEVLTHRALHIGSPSCPPTVTRFDQGQSVIWLRLIYGQYVLVALANPKENVLALYTLLSIQEKKAEPIARIILPGVVSSGELEVQDDQVVIALCFQSP